MFEGRYFRYKKSKSDKPTGIVRSSKETSLDNFWIWSTNGVMYHIYEVDILFDLGKAATDHVIENES